MFLYHFSQLRKIALFSNDLKEEKKERRVFGGGQSRLKWPPSEPIYGDCDRREGIDEARKHPDFYKSFQEYIDEAGLNFE